MEYLDFHSGEKFSDFSLSLENQNDLLAETQYPLNSGDYDYHHYEYNHDSNFALFNSEEEIDHKILPSSGLMECTPKLEIFKEDFEKVLTDWNDHIGAYLGNNDIDDFGLPLPTIENLSSIRNFATETTVVKDTMLPEKILSSPVKQEIPKNHSNNFCNVKLEVENNHNYQNDHNYQNEIVSRLSESDQSEKEIDVVGLGSIKDVKPIKKPMHVKRRVVENTLPKNNSKRLGKITLKLKIKREQNEYMIKKESSDDDESETIPEYEIEEPEEYSKNTKRKRKSTKVKKTPVVKQSNKQTCRFNNKNSNNNDKNNEKKQVPDDNNFVNVTKKIKKGIKVEKYVKEDTSNFVNSSLSSTEDAVLEAGDVKSLLEQFEATEAAAAVASATTLKKKKIQKQGGQQALGSAKTTKTSGAKSTVTLLPEKSVNTHGSKIHQNIRDSIPKEVIDRIKAVSRKKTIPIIPAIPNVKVNAKNNNGTRNSNTLTSRNKVKKLSNDNTNAKDRIQSDHDYCSNSNSTVNSSRASNCSDSGHSEFDMQMNDSDLLSPKKKSSSKQKTNDCQSKSTISTKSSGDYKTINVERKNCSDNGSKKDSGLESGEVSDASEEQHTTSKSIDNTFAHKKVKKNITTLQKKTKSLIVVDKSIDFAKDDDTNDNLKCDNVKKPINETKISTVSTSNSALQFRKGVLGQQMVSVLKNPPAATTPQTVLGTNYKESIVTTTNSLNDEVKNIIVEETTDIDLPDSKEKKPPRRKLNLAEYRNRRLETRSDGSGTNSPVRPMTLIYVHNVSTNTDPMSSEREIISILKPKFEIENKMNQPKCETKEQSVQTIESVFGFYNEVKNTVKNQKIDQDKKPVVKTINNNKKPLQEVELLQEKISSPSKVEKVITVVEINDEDAGQIIKNEEEIENGEIVDSDDGVDEDVKVLKNDTANRNTDINSINKDIDERVGRTFKKSFKHREYRRSRATSNSSRSRSRSCRRSRSRSDLRRRTRTRSRCRSSHRSNRSSRSRSLNTSDSRTSRSSSRSRSRLRYSTRTRRRKISRRSSVSSNSSWSSRSRSRSKYRSRSSSRSRSRSRSSRYSSGSRSSTRSNYGRSKWSSDDQRRRSRGHKINYNRYKRHSSSSSRGYNDRRRSPYRRYDDWQNKEKERQLEERRVIYVGRIRDGITKAELRKRFEVFGRVVDISLHFRENRHNYGFVTFVHKEDAYKAVEHGNDDPKLPRYELCFGGRRQFCKVQYADLDGVANNSLGNPRNMYSTKPEEEYSFDNMLKEAVANLRNRKA